MYKRQIFRPAGYPGSNPLCRPDTACQGNIEMCIRDRLLCAGAEIELMRELALLRHIQELLNPVSYTHLMCIRDRLEAMQEQFVGLMNPEELGEAFGGAADREEEDNDALFTPGGAATFPFLQNIFVNRSASAARASPFDSPQ